MITAIDVATAWAKLDTGHPISPEYLQAQAHYFNTHSDGLIIITTGEWDKQRKEIGRLTTDMVLLSMAGFDGEAMQHQALVIEHYHYYCGQRGGMKTARQTFLKNVEKVVDNVLAKHYIKDSEGNDNDEGTT